MLEAFGCRFPILPKSVTKQDEDMKSQINLIIVHSSGDLLFNLC